MRLLQYIAALAALGATLVASLGSQALHWVAPHDCSRSVGAFSGPRAPATCCHGCHGVSPGQVACAGVQDSGVDNPGRAVGRETTVESPRLVDGSDSARDVDCAICRHFQHVPLDVLAASCSQALSLASTLAPGYLAPQPADVLVGWYSRGPPPCAVLDRG